MSFPIGQNIKIEKYSKRYTMKIEHIAIWTKDIEKSKAFYVKYFGASSNEKYTNKKKGFSSYFLSFDEGCRLEIMNISNTLHLENNTNESFLGIAHFAISVGSKEKVDDLTHTIRVAGFSVVGEPRWTGDGYYESVVLDPDGNKVEITI